VPRPVQMDGVLDEISKTAAAAGIAAADRLRPRALAWPQLDGDLEIAMRGDHLLDQGTERQASKMRLAFGREAGEPLQDLAAALALRSQQPDVVAMDVVVAKRPLHLAGHQRDRCERRAEFVCG